MATPRRRWFYVADSILREDLDATDVGILIRLLAWLNQRRSRDGVEGDEATRAVLRPADVALLTDRERPGAGLARLRQALRTTSARVSCDGRNVLVEWPKVAEFQQWDARTPGSDRAARSPLRTPDSDTDTDSNSKGFRGEDLERLVSSVVGVPERLTSEERITFGRWLQRELPPLWPERLRLERECLAHYRRPELAAAAARVRSWLAACEGWARKAWELQHAEGQLWPSRARAKRSS